ncbi:MAG: GntR family transcriptional regulator [Candidatus Rokubacteria bacterium]|nr:GntR family transcriptional regulator [Candidatus Rokubacteria bacterium]
MPPAPTAEPIDESRAARLYTSLKDAITRGAYLPGAHLVEAELAMKYSASRPTVREVLRRLLADDLVEHVAHRGVRVRRLTLPDIVEIYTVRDPLEALAARLAADAAKQAQRGLTALHREAEGAVRARDPVRFVRLNSALHRAIAEITGNRALLAVLSRLNAPLIGLQFVSVDGALDIASAHRDHQAVIDAILARDAAAAEAAMRRHLQHTRDRIVRATATHEAGNGTTTATLTSVRRRRR